MSGKSKKYLYDYLIDSADAAILLQNEDGSFSSGINGPHRQPETPVRTTAHWACLLLKSYQNSNNQLHLSAATKAIDYLMLPIHRPYEKTYVCRNLPGLDKSNGLVGQAWVMEALIKAYEVLGNRKCLNIAFELFEMHPFNENAGLWKIVDADGSDFRTIYDLVINHQIWFAAAASDLLKFDLPEIKNEMLKKRIDVFLKKLPYNLALNKNNTYRQSITQRFWLLFVSPLNFMKISPAYRNIKRRIKGTQHQIAYGYHAFHTYGLAILKENLSDHKIWTSRLIQRGLNTLLTQKYKELVEISKYGLHYNPPGIEVAYTIQVFSDYFGVKSETHITKWLGWQFTNTWSETDSLMNKVDYDPVTYASRIYEACRLKNYLLT